MQNDNLYTCRSEMGYIAILLNLYMDFMYSLQNRIIVELISEKCDTTLNIYKNPRTT